MNLQDYTQLTPLEKIQFIGKLIHAVQNDQFSFDSAAEIIEIAELKGVFENIKILPDS